MKASMSKTYTKEIDDNIVFCKLKSTDEFDTRTVMFQSKLSEMINGKFAINKLRGINIKQHGTSTYYELEFENLKELSWEPNHDNMRLIGTAMAHIHNFSYTNTSLLNLPAKSESYSDMSKWLYLPKKDSKIKDAHSSRLIIFNDINRFNIAQPKIPVHRDFKLHNIIFDGDRFNLIDFDFAAIDYVSIEIMGFVVDVIKYDIELLNTFFKYYHSTINIPVIPRSYVTDYLNYLCTNTFPFYLKEKLVKESLLNLINYRNDCLNLVYENKEKLETIINNSNYVSY